MCRDDGGIPPGPVPAQERLVRTVMADANYNVAQAARQLGLSREHMYYFIRKFGIERQVP